MGKILIIEAFYGGSHKQLLDTILPNFQESEYDIFTLPANKWHWRARTSSLYFSETIPSTENYDLIFTSSVLPLAEFLGIRYDLQKCKKIVYFHENQLIYPRQEVKKRDVQYGLNQITTCLAADEIIFNSNFNLMSFVDNIKNFLKIQPDLKLRNLREKILQKSCVLYFPIQVEYLPNRADNKSRVLHILWNHRWEHDKNPEMLTEVLMELNKKSVDFNVSILGENTVTPECFVTLKHELGSKLVNFGYQTKNDYYEILKNTDVVVSTAIHEFYGVAMLEACFLGNVPLAPNSLVYPEMYPKEYLYNTSCQLVKLLYNWARNRHLFNVAREKFFTSFDYKKYCTEELVPKFVEKLKLAR